MKKLFILLSSIAFCASLMAQFEVVINVTDAISASGLENATVTLNGTTAQSDINGAAIFTNVSDGTYPYTVEFNCYEDASGSVTVSGADSSDDITMDELTTANVFWSINQDNSPISFPVATAEVSMTDGVNPPITLSYNSTEFIDVMTDVPFGTYTYTISVDCREDATGTVTVGCGTLDPFNPTPTVAVFTAQGPELTTANVFWSINQDNSPISFPVATAEVSMTDGVNPPITLFYNSTEFMDVMADVPFGTYTYTISVDCREDATGTVTVGCGTLDPFNPTPTVAVFTAQGAELTTANVFWSVNQSNSPISFPVASAEISMTDGVNPPITLSYNSTEFMDVMADVPFGTYTYTISVDCREDATGTVTVGCGTLDPFNPTPTVAVFTAQGPELTTANVFWSINQDNSPISFPVATAEVSMTDGVNPPITLSYNSTEFMDVMTDVPFGTYTYTISVDCREDATGTVTVGCGTLDPFNPIPTVAVFTAQGPELTTANVFWSINQDNSPISFPVATAEVSMTDGVNPPITLSYNSTEFMDVMADVPFGTYTYTISVDCREDATGTVTVGCGTLDPFNPTPTVAVFTAQGPELTTANVFWSINQDNSPISFPVATAEVSMTDGVNPPITLSYNSTEFMDVMADVPFGTYTYTISVDCREDATGTVTVGCGTLDPFNPTPTVAVFTAQGPELTTANVFWSINQDNSPISFPVATAEVSMTDGVNPPITLSYNSTEFIDVMTDVPFGTYTYTISVDCREDATGTVTVGCGTLDPFNPTPTVAVFTAQGPELTTANVFWSINQDNSPISFPVATAEVSMTDGVNPPITLSYNSTEFMDVMTDVPFGTYTYTISVDCREDATGTVTVGCGTLDPFNPTPTVAVFTAQGPELTTANVFWSINQDNSPISFPVATAEVSMTDGVNPPITLSYNSTEFMDVMADVPFGTYTYTISVEGREDVVGTVVVGCETLDPFNPTPTVAVFEVQGDEAGPVEGCTDPLYLEFDPYAEIENGTCVTLVIEGCTYADADNFNPDANQDDESCIFSLDACQGDFTGDGAVTVSDLSGFLAVFGTLCD